MCFCLLISMMERLAPTSFLIIMLAHVILASMPRRSMVFEVLILMLVGVQDSPRHSHGLFASISKACKRVRETDA